MTLAAGRLLAVALAFTVAAAAPDDPLVDQQWHLPHIGTFATWEVGRGEGVVVAVVDTGVDHRHPDLQGRLGPGVDLVDRGTTPDDPNGHGTIVAGIVAATAGNATGGAGVAPLARIMPVRVLGADGEGSSRTVAEGIRWAANRGADVINLSLADAPGQTSDMTSLITTDVELAIREASLRGSLVVVAAGNEGRSATPYRSGLPALVVGASDRDDRPWRHSNRDERTLFAPGVEIVSTFRDGQYVKADGTSFAAPVVAAAAAILREQGLDADEARERLLATAVDIGAGLGRLDLAAAAGVAPPPAAGEPPDRTPPPPAETAPEPAGTPPPGPTVAPLDGPPLPQPDPEPDPVDDPAAAPREPVAADDERVVVIEPPVEQPPAGSWPSPREPAAPLPGWLVALAATLLAVDLLGLVVAVAGRRGAPAD